MSDRQCGLPSTPTSTGAQPDVRPSRSPSTTGPKPGFPALLFPLIFLFYGCGDGSVADRGELDGDAAPQPEASPRPVPDTALEAAFRAIAAELPGEIGIAALHLQRELVAFHEPDRPFPLASVAKLPVAYAALRRPDVEGSASARVAATDRAPGDTPFRAGVEVSVARLVERSLAHSDNTASDVLLRLAGGPEAVAHTLRELGIDGLRVDRSMKQIFAAWRGVGDAEGVEGLTLAELDRRAAAVPPAARAEAQSLFGGDPRDTGSARGTLELLVALHEGRGLMPEDRELVLQGMRGAVTGPNRIRAGVPEGAAVAHKTATLGRWTHDVGIISLPDGAGDVALVVLIGSDAPLAARERAIASAARAVWQRHAEAEPPAGAAGSRSPSPASRSGVPNPPEAERHLRRE
jgi:beta-lactamase class A